MELIEWVRNYNNKEIIDIKKELTEKELKIIKNFSATIQDKIYTELEYDELKESLFLNFCEEDSKYTKPSLYGMKNEEFDIIFNKFNEIDKKYEKSFNKIEFKDNIPKKIDYSQRQIIRDNFMILLENDKITDEQKQLVLEIIINMKNVFFKQKERFIMYYGLDLKKEKIHSFTKIAKIQNCSNSCIRQGVWTVRRKILSLPTKEIKILEKMVESYQ